MTRIHFPSALAAACVYTTTSHAPRAGSVSTMLEGAALASVWNAGNRFSNTATSHGPAGSSVGAAVSARCTRTPAASTMISPPAGTLCTPSNRVRPGGGYWSAADIRRAASSQRGGSPAAKSARAVLPSITRAAASPIFSGSVPAAVIRTHGVSP